jgi:hypothetical protein
VTGDTVEQWEKAVNSLGIVMTSLTVTMIGEEQAHQKRQFAERI